MLRQVAETEGLVGHAANEVTLRATVLARLAHHACAAAERYLIYRMVY
jgi:hypothetical protein